MASLGCFASSVFEKVVFPVRRWEFFSGSPRTLNHSLSGLLAPGATPGRPWPCIMALTPLGDPVVQVLLVPFYRRGKGG